MAVFVKSSIKPMIRKLIPFFILQIILPFALYSQTIEEWTSAGRNVPDQRIYLHCDREFYFCRETIWFRAYVLNSLTFQPTVGEENLFVDLLDESGKIIVKSTLIVINGAASGYITLVDSVKSGTFILRAYTDYLKNFGEETFFYRPVKISEVMNSVKMNETIQSAFRRKNNLPDVAYLPEGGFLLSGQSNLVAVKATDSSGMGVKVRGTVCSESGDPVASFETGYKGMASFYFNPQEGIDYHVKLRDFPEYDYRFTDIRNKGIKLQLQVQNDGEILLNTVSNGDYFVGKEFYLVNMYHGLVEFYKKFRIENTNRLFRFNKKMFPGGINRLLLLNDELQPVSERMVFSDNYRVNNLTVLTDSDSYSTRSEINLQVTDQAGSGTVGISDFSVAVVDENSVNAGGPSRNILSWLLLGSELKGHVEAPADCFVSDSLLSFEKLDLVMLTNGWSNYLVNNLTAKNDTSVFHHSSGIHLSGRVKKLLVRKPIENGAISMLIFKKGEVKYLDGKTDQKGQFSFDGIYFTDTASVFVQARTEKGRKSTELFLDPVFENRPEMNLPELKKFKNFPDIPVGLYRRKYLNDLAIREFQSDTGSIMLGEVEIKRPKKEKEEDHFKIYGSADNSLKITDRDLSYPDVLSFLSGRVAGLMIAGDKISIRGGGTPLFLIDGMPFEGEDGIIMIRSIPMGDIDVVDVLKDISNLALFGSRGANGVIAVYTKRGFTGKVNDYLKGAITSKIIGYQPLRQFYSPKYTPENVNLPDPDYRTTLYWNPQVNPVNGEARLTFFSCDEVTNYRIFIEGITTDGRICLGSGQFTVDRFRESNTEKQNIPGK